MTTAPSPRRRRSAPEGAHTPERISAVVVGGRAVAFAEWGPADGAPVLLFHGRPGSRLLRHVGGEYDRVGVRVVTMDRPGYGASDRRPGRSVADGAVDAAAVADHLGLERFAVIGISAGGPFALATAASLPARITRCATVVGLAPIDAEGLDFFAGMDEESLAEWQQAEAGEETMIAESRSGVRHLIEMLSEAQDLPAPTRTMLIETVTEAVRQGYGGMVDDSLAGLRPWGVDLTRVACPTRVLIARDDTIVPPAHGRWLAAHIPGAEAVLVDGGHLGPRDEAEEAVLRWLAGGS